MLAALRLRNAKVDASDIAQDAPSVAERNVRDYGLTGVVSLQSDLFSGLENRRYDLILSNPSYVERMKP